ncbi:MAG TPA: Zn-ribbon domain-containing OB-fold protein [Tepidisphaeraceae bacterium]
MSEYRKPLPVPSDDSAPFWEACRKHELLMQRCHKCEHVTFPPTAHCPRCLSPSMTWISTSGKGTIYSFVIYRRAYHPGFEDQLPYVVALVQLEEGPRLISNIVDCDPQAVRCDMPVEVVFDDVTPDVTLFKFRPRRERSSS